MTTIPTTVTRMLTPTIDPAISHPLLLVTLATPATTLTMTPMTADPFLSHRVIPTWGTDLLTLMPGPTQTTMRGGRPRWTRRLQVWGEWVSQEAAWPNGLGRGSRTREAVGLNRCCQQLSAPLLHSLGLLLAECVVLWMSWKPEHSVCCWEDEMKSWRPVYTDTCVCVCVCVCVTVCVYVCVCLLKKLR